MLRLKTLLIQLRSSLWFLPTLIVLGSAAFAVVFIEIDSSFSFELSNRFPRLFGAGAEGSRGMLSSIASSMITVAGVTFSITIVALSQAANQYSSRILRNFMRDRANQAVLGVFLGIFTYCLLVLRAIRGADEGDFVPSLSVFGGLVLALVAIGFLIYFIHHVASSLQASNVIAAAANETVGTIERLFPESLHEKEEDPEDIAAEHTTLKDKRRITIAAPKTGYIQSHDLEAFVHLACAHQLVLRMHAGVGDFAVFDSPIVTVYTDGPLDEELVENVQDAYSINALRTIEQDPRFGIRQIVDIALKALSPGVNDTTTALICIDYLTAINVRLANKRIARPLVYQDGQLRVVAKGPTFEMFVEESFDEIRADAAGKTKVILHLINSIKTIGGATDSPARRYLLSKQISLLQDLTKETIHSDHDLARIKRSLDSVAALMNGPTSESGQTNS